MTLNDTDLKQISRAIGDLAGYAESDREMDRLLTLAAKVDRHRTDRLRTKTDEQVVRKVIDRVKADSRIFPLNAATLDEIGSALIEGRRTRKTSGR